MIKKLLFLSVVLATNQVACTKANPNACCVSADDCKQAGLSSVKGCDQGLTCVDNQCIQQTCSTDGCMADKPVCNVVTNVCDGCTASNQCASYAGQTVCDPSTGACVGCVSTTDCPSAMPVCDTGACRDCKLDSDCASGACADDGSCVTAGEIIYLDPGGTDTGTCTESMPCRSITYALSLLSDARLHIVMSAGAYVENVNDRTSRAQPLAYLHGGGATLTNPNGNDGATFTSTQISLRNLTIVNTGGNGVVLTDGEMRHCHLQASGIGVSIGGVSTLYDTDINASGVAGVTALAGTLTTDRVVVHGGATTGIKAGDFAATVNVQNSLVYGAAGLAMDLTMGAGGNVTFSTIADSGLNTTSGPRGVSCASNVTFKSCIIWVPGSISQTPIQGCNVASSIAGPTPVAGVSNGDPKFVNAALHDYHLSAASPAIDFVDVGPDHDLDGQPRPKGAKFDIGAYEAN